MSERASYSRVYWSIVDDPKFESIYDSDQNLAAWLRLLLIADQSHPASGHIPSNVRRNAVKALTDVGLIDLMTGSRYRIHGLDAERGRRRDAATRLRTGRDPDGDQLPPARDPVGTQTARTHRAEGRDETRLDEKRTPKPPPSGGLPEEATRANGTNLRALGKSPRQLAKVASAIDEDAAHRRRLERTRSETTELRDHLESTAPKPEPWEDSGL